MMMNIGIRMIIDKENNKSYISIDGNIENATRQDREEVRDTLTEAFSKILGLKEEAEIGQVTDDFKAMDHEDDVAEFLREAVEETEKRDWKKEFQDKKSIKLGFGSYSNLTPYQVLVKLQDKGIKELNGLKGVYKKNLDKYPNNKRKIEEIEKALKEYEDRDK